MASVRFEKHSARVDSFTLEYLTALIPELALQFKGYRIAFLTDLHFGPATSLEHIAEALTIASRAKPDLLALGGDCIQLSRSGIWHIAATRLNPKMFKWTDYRRAVRKLAKELSACLEDFSFPDGIVGVFGNHEYHDGWATVVRQLPRSIRWLRNDSVFINRDEARLFIGGLDDYNRGKPDIKAALAPLYNSRAQSSQDPAPFFRLLLSHNPDLVLHREKDLLSLVDLILCGHTHGGQICLPLGLPIITRTRQKKHISGLSQSANTAIYVSKGVGYSMLPLRTFCPPEITLLTLEQERSASQEL